MQDSATVRLQQECVIVQGAIDHLIACRKRLEENIAQAKAQVSSNATDALDTLRSREIQLLRQIDVIESHHSNVLLVQHAKLNQLLGNLKHTLYCARHQQNVPMNSVSDEDMEVVHDVNRLRDAQNPLVKFYCDMNRMVAAIQNFGVVESTGHLLNAEKEDVVSRCLPSRVEEYEDSDHQLLYKTLEELKLEAGGRQQICVAFPKLSVKKEDWLKTDSRSQASAIGGSEREPNFVLPDYLVDSDNSRWLKGSSKQATTFDKLVSKDGCIDNWLRRQMVQTKKNNLPTLSVSSDCPCSCGTSESIEMISNSDTMDSTGEYTWLANPSEQLFLRNSRAQTKKEEWFCRNSGAVDIENLGSMSCAAKGAKSTLPFKDQHLWLAFSGNGDELEEDIRDVAIAQVCCANEPCRTFSDCVCDVTCDIREAGGVLDKNRKTTLYSDLAEWLKNPTKEFRFVSDDSVDGNGGVKWLRRADFLTEMEKMDVSEKDRNNAEVSDDKVSPPVHCDWLKNYLASSIDEASNTFRVRHDFLPYFLPGNLKEWLSS